MNYFCPNACKRFARNLCDMLLLKPFREMIISCPWTYVLLILEARLTAVIVFTPENHKLTPWLLSANYIGASGNVVADRILGTIISIMDRVGSGRWRFKRLRSCSRRTTILIGPAVEITKIECVCVCVCLLSVGYVQMRLGTKPKNNVTKAKRLVTENIFPAGMGWLRKLFNGCNLFMSKAIRRNSYKTKDMRRGVWALYYLVKYRNENPVHILFPSTDDTRCMYNRAVKK